MYALIEFSGKQYKIEEGNSIKVPSLIGEIGSKVTFDNILYMDDGKNKTVGNPFLNDVKITGEIESHGRGRKVVVFKFKRRKGYQKKNTSRQEYTILKIGKFGTNKKSSTTKKTTASATKKTVDKEGQIKKSVPKTVVKKTTMIKKTVKKSIDSKKEKD